MCEDVYARPDLTKKVRYGRGERERDTEERGEKEDRGERKEMIVDIYVTADDLDPGTRRDAVENHTAQDQHGGSGESKKKGSRAAAVCLGLLCLLLLAVITFLVIHYQTSFEELQSRYNNLTEHKEQIQSRYNNITEERDDLKRRLCELPGWQTFGRDCYYISSKKKTWEESRQHCRDRQSDLVVINSKEKQDFVIRLNQWVWLGLRKEEGTKRTWTWVDGTPLTTPTYWIPGEPNNLGKYPNTEEDCADFFNGSKPELRGWNDMSCFETNLWICERAL